ncbi:hypothetical protein SLS63_011838 [Diaporthe eres]|uniref:Rhodopsin domain-containing protein n=1 Tax=Diaporthe eres TaxID=83184 RepID=A0ABR1NSX3_DIAER
MDRSLSFEELDDYSGDKVLAISIPFIVLTTIFVALRFCSKRLMRSRSGWDDLLLVVAYLVNVGLFAVVIVMTKIAGVGYHEKWVTNTNPSQIVRWAQLLLIFEFLHFAGVALPKLAIIFFYIRVFNWKGRMRTICYTAMGLLVATWLGSALAACLQCRPLAFWWDKTIQGGTCFDVQLFFRAQAITSPILDTVILALPVRSIWGLKLPESKRIELLLVFGVAGFGIIASIIRVQIFFTTAAFADRTCLCPLALSALISEHAFQK